MLPKPGYVYSISDEYFKTVNDPNLMQNKRNGRSRPCYCCMKDSNTGLYWMIPLSSQISKFQIPYQRNISRYGDCVTLVLDQYAGKKAAYVIQNAFPVTAKYINSVFRVQKKPEPVKCRLQRVIYAKLQKCLHIHNKGYTIFYTNIDRAQQRMLEQIK